MKTFFSKNQLQVRTKELYTFLSPNKTLDSIVGQGENSSISLQKL